MEPLFEAILVLIGTILEGLLELLGEAVLDLATRALAEVFKTAEISNPALAVLGYFLLGSIAGGLSLALFPHPLVHPSRIHGISLLVSPLLAGATMSLVGAMLRAQNRRAVQIESFRYGFAFAFGMALIRLLFAR